MPNHLHGVLMLDHLAAGGSRAAPTGRKPLGSLVGAFKTVSTKRANQLMGSPGRPFWQRGYYEHVVRNEDDLARISEYIIENPDHWHRDGENPDRSASAVPYPWA